MKRILLCIASLLVASSVLAGSKGFTVVMLNIGDPDFFESPIYKTFRDGGADRLPEAQGCWDKSATGGKSLRHTTRIKLPPGMTQELAQSIWDGNPTALNAAREILKKGDEFTSESNEYDGLYILQPRGNRLILMAIGSRSKTPSRKLTLQLDKDNPGKASEQFDLALCKVSKPLGIGFGP